MWSPREEFAAQQDAPRRYGGSGRQPLGTLKYTVGEISRRLRTVSSMPPASSTLVEMRRAAVEQRQADIVITAAKGMIPRQPVIDDGRLVLQENQRFAQHHLVGATLFIADHALGVDDRLSRIAGRARRQQNFAIVSGPIASCTVSTRG